MDGFASVKRRSSQVIDDAGGGSYPSCPAPQVPFPPLFYRGSLIHTRHTRFSRAVTKSFVSSSLHLLDPLPPTDVRPGSLPLLALHPGLRRTGESKCACWATRSGAPHQGNPPGCRDPGVGTHGGSPQGRGGLRVGNIRVLYPQLCNARCCKRLSLSPHIRPDSCCLGDNGPGCHEAPPQ